jgi:hypothetical protein
MSVFFAVPFSIISQFSSVLRLLIATVQKLGRTSTSTFDVEGILCAIFPDIEFLRGSFETLTYEYSDLEYALTVLRQIVFEGKQGKPVRGAQGWYELHMNTGFSDDGRLYFTHSQNGKRHVLFSRKGNQKQDIELLKNY